MFMKWLMKFLKDDLFEYIPITEGTEFQ